MTATHTIQDIKQLFEAEFSSVREKFVVRELSVSNASRIGDPMATMGGVYVWWKNGTTYKVGRHLLNTRKRALEHLRDDTGKQLRSLASDPTTVLLLFNLRNPADLHWAFALEDYLEARLNPLVKSKRRG